MKAIMIVVAFMLGAALAAAAVLAFQGRIPALQVGRVGAAARTAAGNPASSPAATKPSTPPAASQTLLDAAGTGSTITPNFTVAGEWDLAWAFDCTSAGRERNLGMAIENGGGTPPREFMHSVVELAEKKQGTVHNTAAGTFHLNVEAAAPCTWRATVTGPPGPPPPTPGGRTLLDVAGSGRKTTQAFVAGGDWDLFWSYDCTKVGHSTNFGISAEGQGGSGGEGVSQLGEQEAGMVHNESGGSFQLQVDASQQCSWHVTVSG
jgi:hypothetical protein